jgi:hypothetical protein
MGQGSSGPQGERGLQGPKGDIGPKGDKGETVWSSLNTTEKEEIMAKLKTYAELKGPKGDKGDQGPPGDPTEVAKLATINNAFMQSLGTNIVANATTLSENVAKALTDDVVRRNTLVDAVHIKPTFQDAIADKLSSNATYRARIKGDPGDAANPESLKLALKPQTMWCADGDFCEAPANKAGVMLPSKLFVLAKDQKIDGKDWNKGLHIQNPDGRFTHFPAGDQINYIRGNTQIDGNTQIYGNTRVNGNVILNENNISARGFTGPFRLRFYDKNTCLDSGQFFGNGDLGCMDNNPFQQFYYSPVTGQLKNVQSGKCLDIAGNGKWDFYPCNNNQVQQFHRIEHLLKWKNGDCLDSGNQNHHASCDGNQKNQTIVWEYIGQ